MNALHLSCASGDFATVKRLLSEYGSQAANFRTKGKGIPPLYAAAEYGQVSVVTLLLSWGANVNQGPTPVPIKMQDDDSVIITSGSPLVAAVDRGHLDVLEALLVSGANPNSLPSNCDITPLHVAAKNSPIEVVEFLLAAKSEMNARRFLRKETPLCVALRAGRINVLRSLLTARADPTIGGTGGITPLHLACYECSPPLPNLTLLLEFKAEVDCRTDFGNTPLHLASISNPLGCAVFELLLREGADMDAENAHRETPYNTVCRLVRNNPLTPQLGSSHPIELFDSYRVHRLSSWRTRIQLVGLLCSVSGMSRRTSFIVAKDLLPGIAGFFALRWPPL